MSNDIKFDELDKRVILQFESYRYKIDIYQIEILRLINLLETANSTVLAKKFRRILFIKDNNDNTLTDFNRRLPKGDITKKILTSKEYYKIRRNHYEIDNEMEKYYKKAKIKL